MAKTAPNFPPKSNYPKPAKAATKNAADKAAAKPDQRKAVREEHSNHFTNRADAKGQ